MLIGLVLAAAVSLSCIFEPRATTEYDQVGGKDIQPAREPEMVISNMVTIVQGLDSANYPDLFSEDFYFVPDPEDVDFMNNHYGPGVYLDWDNLVEVYVAGNLFDRLNYALLNIEVIEVAEETPNTYVGYHEYTLSILPQGGTWTRFSGIAHLYMRVTEDDLWEIIRWDDFRQPEVSDSVNGTWGLLKGEIRATT
ncbi:hypothetical protein ACFL2Z_05270 [Candidatus Eisenbacteria bacterium]|uniref:SnoaL-like domain-containing protein n=1 Tax=Eiseniibacteriota bacterium TaxID=2212470 RepID=A0ABV6YQE3_UNCEI